MREKKGNKLLLSFVIGVTMLLAKLEKKPLTSESGCHYRVYYQAKLITQKPEYRPKIVIESPCAKRKF